ncbi:MAG: amidase family protein, partial [Burkholderiales bacterium]
MDAVRARKKHSSGLSEFDRFDAVGLAELVRSRKAKPIEILEAAIARSEAVNPKLNAIVQKLYDHGRSAIERGLPKGPLAGVPFLLKDLHALCTGTATTYGCRFFRDNIADHDSELV